MCINKINNLFVILYSCATCIPEQLSINDKYLFVYTKKYHDFSVEIS